MVEKYKNLLVAEDEESLSHSLFLILAGAGYNVITASTGNDAFVKIKERHNTPQAIEILITDVQMPGMTGEELLDELAKINIFVPALVMTGFGTKDLLLSLLRKGIKDYIDKPFTSVEFMSRLSIMRDKIIADEDKLHRNNLQTDNSPSVDDSLLKRFVNRYEIYLQDDNIGVMTDATTPLLSKYLDIYYKSKKIKPNDGDNVFVYTGEEFVDLLLVDLPNRDSASKCSIMVKAFFDCNRDEHLSGEEFLSILNKGLIQAKFERMVTAQYIHINIIEKTIELCTAAYQSGILIEKENNRMSIQNVQGPVLGFIEDAPFQSVKLQFQKEDKFIIYSDGLPGLCRTDSISGQRLYLAPAGIEKLAEQYRAFPLADLIDKIWNDAFSFARYKTNDDVSLLGISLKPDLA